MPVGDALALRAHLEATGLAGIPAAPEEVSGLWRLIEDARLALPLIPLIAGDGPS